jgi:hypothetical protein
VAKPESDAASSINGMEADDDMINRRVVAVKIDNHPRARPQVVLNEADVVYETLVEGGITRFIALYQTKDFDKVGPNRSGRVTDTDLIKPLDAVFQISGAQKWVRDIFAADGINVLYDNGITTFRDKSRPAPHNLFASTVKIRERADSKNWSDENPGNMFVFGEAPGSGVAATSVSMSFSGAPNANWEWDDEAYLRSNGSSAHMTVNPDGQTEQVSADVLVALTVREYIARNPAGSGTPLPTADTIGDGLAQVFYNGEVVEGTWMREKDTDMFTLLNEDGTFMVIPAGRLWISLIPNTESVTWE